MCDNPKKRSRSNVHALAVRISDVYKDWHKNLGPSLEAFPLKHLQIVRAVLCRYRFLRSTKPTDKTADLGVQWRRRSKIFWGKRVFLHSNTNTYTRQSWAESTCGCVHRNGRSSDKIPTSIETRHSVRCTSHKVPLH